MKQTRTLNIMVTQDGKPTRFQFEIPDSDETRSRILYKWGNIDDPAADGVLIWEAIATTISSKDDKS